MIKKLAIAAVGVGVGVEGIIDAVRGGKKMSQEELLAHRKTLSPTKRILASTWTLAKTAAAVTKTVTVIQHLRK